MIKTIDKLEVIKYLRNIFLFLDEFDIDSILMDTEKHYLGVFNKEQDNLNGGSTLFNLDNLNKFEMDYDKYKFCMYLLDELKESVNANDSEDFITYIKKSHIRVIDEVIEKIRKLYINLIRDEKINSIL